MLTGPHDVELDVLDDSARPLLAAASEQAAAARHYDMDYQTELHWWTGHSFTTEGVPRTALVSDAEAARVPIARTFPSAPHSQRRGEIDDQARLLVLSSTGNTIADWLHTGEALSALLLECTALGLATCALTHITELPAARKAIDSVLTSAGVPQVIIRVGVASHPPSPNRARRHHGARSARSSPSAAILPRPRTADLIRNRFPSRWPLVLPERRGTATSSAAWPVREFEVVRPTWGRAADAPAGILSARSKSGVADKIDPAGVRAMAAMPVCGRIPDWGRGRIPRQRCRGVSLPSVDSLSVAQSAQESWACGWARSSHTRYVPVTAAMTEAMSNPPPMPIAAVRAPG